MTENKQLTEMAKKARENFRQKQETAAKLELIRLKGPKYMKAKTVINDFLKFAAEQYGFKNGFSIKLDDFFYKALLKDIKKCKKLVIVLNAEEGGIDTIFIDKSFQEIQDYLRFDLKHDQYEILMVMLPNKTWGEQAFLRAGYKKDFLD